MERIQPVLPNTEALRLLEGLCSQVHNQMIRKLEDPGWTPSEQEQVLLLRKSSGWVRSALLPGTSTDRLVCGAVIRGPSTYRLGTMIY
jgi:hypothetical protein